MYASWERAVKAALNGETDVEAVRTLTLDGVVKCINGRLPPPSLFERFHNLQHLSMANIGVSSLEQFPRLQKLQKLILSDNRIADRLEYLVEAGLNSLTDLDLSNNRISDIDDLKPLTKLSLVSLDLYECPITRVKDYQRRVFGLIKSLKYLDKMDADENERPESDDEEEDEDDDYALSGEFDGEDRTSKLINGLRSGNEGIVDADDYEKSDTDEEGGEIAGTADVLNEGHVSHDNSNGFKDNAEGEDDLVVEEYDDDENGDYDDVIEVHEIEEDGDGKVEIDDDDDDDIDDDDDDDEDDEEEVEEEEDEDEDGLDDDERVPGYPVNTLGESGPHHMLEDDANEIDDGETGEEEAQVSEDDGDLYDDEELKYQLKNNSGSEYVNQPNGRVYLDPGSSSDSGEDEDITLEDDEYHDGEVQEMSPPSSCRRKRARGDEDDESDDEEDEEDVVEQHSKSSKH